MAGQDVAGGRGTVAWPSVFVRGVNLGLKGLLLIPETDSHERRDLDVETQTSLHLL